MSAISEKCQCVYPSLSETGEFIGVSSIRVQRWIAEGIWHAPKFGPRAIRVQLSSPYALGDEVLAIEATS